MGSIKIDLNRSFLKEGALGVALFFVLGTRRQFIQRGS
jgi:hypothetical protein